MGRVLVRALGWWLLTLAAGTVWAKESAPNILFIVADDLGYGDLGSYGQTMIRTPNLDRLAREGVRLTRHYAGSAVCAPSRCVLLTGMHPGHAWIRDNREVQPEGQWPLPEGTPTLPALLRGLGYATGGFGKWGLGGPGSSGDPLRQGFDRFFGYYCQRLAHNHYPSFLRDDGRRRALANPEFSAHQRLPAGADPKDPASYRAFAGVEYAPDLMLREAEKFMRDRRDGPFFLYYPTAIPHLALQAPPEALAEYAGAFPDDPPYTGNASYLPHPTPRAAYAAMITRLDHDVGRLLALIDELGLRERTLVIFTADNGPLWDRFGGTDTAFFDSAAGLRGRKGSLYEGGIRVPCLVRWSGRIPAGRVVDRVTGFEDWLPTLLELAGGRRRIPRDTDGTSFVPVLFGKRQRDRPFLYREGTSYGGQQMVRVGDWKAVRQGLLGVSTNSPGPVTQLFNLRLDPAEANDQAAARPEVVARLERLFRREHRPSPDFPIPVLDQASKTRTP